MESWYPGQPRNCISLISQPVPASSPSVQTSSQGSCEDRGQMACMHMGRVTVWPQEKISFWIELIAVGPNFRVHVDAVDWDRDDTSL